jgi:NAD(P)-dependent dehydrogenase (short-subunit alcohol dehydrogenase family)
MKRFAGKVGIVTGASSGIGAAAAEIFAVEGATVVLAARREKEGEEIAQTIRTAGGEALFVQTDVAKEADIKNLIEQTVKTYGRLDFAFNNAGVEGKFAPITELTAADFDFTAGINLKGVWLSLKYEIEQMLKQETGGAIVNTSSWLARGGLGGPTVYSATKGALESMARAAALEAAPFNIRVNNINPGIIDTEMLRRFFNPDEQPDNPFTRHTPARRLGTAEETARLAVWLCSDEAKFINGESILIDGGFTIPGFRL